MRTVKRKHLGAGRDESRMRGGHKDYKLVGARRPSTTTRSPVEGGAMPDASNERTKECCRNTNAKDDAVPLTKIERGGHGTSR
jgi:hypothetical protein